MTLLSTCLIALSTLVGPSSRSTPVVPGVAPAVRPDATAAAEYLTKLRKLHLVRPDLINYPLAIDFIC